ncbi:uncharacterized protein LOC128239006 isoform X1 [Mya arenaria]|uniref:uncharacterized protein LOC128239006 isoform X1 n=1 Tax=Mya arenaria TaxID=6604 RepID=UPI0022E672D1|nr:uncharacterized protein LOC128239006 isoform X1 [Mya arenaria]XP_052811370.1 uncharacterized protein LOC128239006 isoform X1 [Mya arenaria]XP_052811371.1 uncharacterized protein LOC128239006 isoform X1 [Mya arenaria]
MFKHLETKRQAIIHEVLKLHEALQSADETKKMSEVMLQSLQELDHRPDPCPCSDVLRDAQTALTQLNSKVELLNESNREREGRCTELQTQIWDMRNALSKLQTDMLDQSEKNTGSNQNYCSDGTTTSARTDNTCSHSEAGHPRSYQELENCGATQASSSSKPKLLQKESIDVRTPFAGNKESNDNQRSCQDNVVRQRVKAYKAGLHEWHALALHEGKFDIRTDLNGIRNVVLIDISESMVDAWTQVKGFFNDFLSGLASLMDYGINEERVALATFGHETKVRQKLTGDIQVLKSAFEQITLGGPTPFAAGLLLSMAALGFFERTGSVVVLNGIELPSRIIILTDGYPTETDLYMGPDAADNSQIELTKHGIISILEQTRGRKIEFCFVPIGNANHELINVMAGVVKGKVNSHQDGHKLARRTLDTMVKGQSGGVLQGLPCGGDLEKLKEFLTTTRDRLDSYLETTGSNLPAPGSRVSRGPDWNYSDDQDKWMPGTIVGHTNDDRVWVNWDAPGTGVLTYRYGMGGAYDVLLTDEARTLEDGETLAVGCKVRSGIGLRNSATKIGSKTIGTVLRIHLDRGQPKALVRWRNGKRGEYTYMADGSTPPEIELISQ